MLLWGPIQVTLPELAVLVQNKAYEHTASEFEEQLFCRGNASGTDALDIHHPMVGPLPHWLNLNEGLGCLRS